MTVMRRFLFGLLASLFLLTGCRASGVFGPAGGMTAAPVEIVRRATPVTFAQLDDNPGAYEDQVIRVGGAYLKLPPPVCSPQRGPAFAWSLTNLVQTTGDWLRIDAQGFEDVLWLTPDGTPMTVEGYWRLYEGPLGCGKNAPREALWYLDVLRIVEPNPLPVFAGAGGLTLTPGGLDVQIMPLATLTPAGAPTAAVPGTPGPTGAPATITPPGLPQTPTATPTATGTLAPGVTPTITPTPTVTPTPAASPTAGSPPPPTPPDDGYPPPPSPQPTPPGGYP